MKAKIAFEQDLEKDAAKKPSFWQRLKAALYPLVRDDEKGTLLNRLALILAIAGIGCGFATYLLLGTASMEGGDPDTVFWLLNIDLVILLLLVMLVARRMVGLFSGRRRGLAGSKIHVRLVFLFSILAVTPAIIMAVFSAFFFHYGVQSWFSTRIQTAVTESQEVAEAYLEEHKQIIRADLLGMANDLERNALYLSTKDEALDRVMLTQSLLRNFSETVLFDSQGRVLASAGVTLRTDPTALPSDIMENLRTGEVIVLTGDTGDGLVKAATKLNSYVDTYLMVSRLVDPQVLAHVDATRRAVESYTRLEGTRLNLQVTFFLIYLVVALLLLLVAIWTGLAFARRIVTPVREIVGAAERVRGGDLTARIPQQSSADEFDYLGRSFNRMTEQIERQRDELIKANRQLDERNRFTETVLSGVSSGVIGIDEDRKVTLVNATALQLLGIQKEKLLGKDIRKFLPRAEELLSKALSRHIPQTARHQAPVLAETGPGQVQQMEVSYIQGSEGSTLKEEAVNRTKTFLVRLTVSSKSAQEKSIVLTLDDITGLLTAQRKAAWADVARRIAHEIKNPLTPIQLSAERLKRKYAAQISQDRDVFENCIHTIIKHVSDIGHMVNEFSAFARMPEPSFREENIYALVRDLVLFQKQVHPQISYSFRAAPAIQEKQMLCDPQKLRQALLNLLQNALDSLQAGNTDFEPQEGRKVPSISIYMGVGPDPEGSEYSVSSPGSGNKREKRPYEERLYIIVRDNGPGFPESIERSRLTDPYVTGKEKGTGLGLAIVKKIMEDHGGDLVLGHLPWMEESEAEAEAQGDIYTGGCVCLVLPVRHLTEEHEKDRKKAY